MYKSTSDTLQRQARQLWLADLKADVDWDNLPLEERRANLVVAKKALEKNLLALPKKSAERAEIGQRLMLMNAEINALRPKRKGPESVPQFFVDVVRESVGKVQFSAWIGEAMRRAETRGTK